MDWRSFKSALRRFDKSLDLDYNRKIRAFEIIGRDRQNKRYVVQRIKEEHINNYGTEFILELWKRSPKHQGAKELNKQQDEMYEQMEKDEDKRLKDELESRHEEAYARMQYREGSRVSFAGNETSFAINDKRRFVESPSGEILKEASQCM